MEIFKLLSITLGAILANNFIFSQFLGCCPFLGVSKKVDTAVGMGVAVTFVMGLASAVCFVVNRFILIPLDLAYMQTVAFILVNNFIFSQFLGCCPFLGVSKKVDTAVGMGIAVTFVMGLASAVCYVVNALVLIPLDLEYMQTVAFILVIAALVQFIEMFLQKSMPSLYTALGIYLPLITTNCAVLGVVLLNVQNNYNFIESVVYGVTGGLGFLLAIVLFASIRERLVFADYPKAFEGFPIALVTAGLMALAFMGFSGLKVW